MNYDFRNLLSAFEFENFTRDLINAEEGLDLCSFAEGRDGGIDLRYSYGMGKTVIVQAKRYRDYAELKPKLKDEVEKVKKLNPTRYMLSTSVDLSAANKQDIIAQFNPYIQSEHDILAKQDLNKILERHPDVERNHYKLWLASANVLNSLLHQSILNWRNAKEGDIQRTVRTYVMNDSFDEALTKLLKNHYVVISGEPGIGKTTLAEILVMHLLTDVFKGQEGASAYEEFYYTNSNIEDLMNVLQAGKKQVFVFDDFLGQITLEEGEKNFENRILTFIRACQAADDKLFVLTTREYILQQGLVRYPNFKAKKGIESSKCVVDMGKYTRFIRAQILYNHLVASELPEPYIDAILADKNYLKIIDHPHYSPRIIETFLNNGTHEKCAPDVYFKKVEGYFNEPDSVWLDAFSLLNSVGREALWVLTTMSTPVMLDAWHEAYDYFFRQTHKDANYLTEHEWNDAVKMLLDNFIRTGKGEKGHYVEFHNPGIKDVLTRYIDKDNVLRNLLLNHACFVEQVYWHVRCNIRIYGQGNVPASEMNVVVSAFDRIWENHRSCNVVMYKESDTYSYYQPAHRSRVESLYWLTLSDTGLPSSLPGYVESKITQQLMSGDGNGSLADQLSLLDKVDIGRTALDMDALFEDYQGRLNSSGDCLNLADSIDKLFPNHKDFILSDTFCNIARICLEQEMLNIAGEDLDDIDSTATELCKYNPNLEYEPIIEKIHKDCQDYSDWIESRIEAYKDDYEFLRHDPPSKDDREIDNLFSTIKEN